MFVERRGIFPRKGFVSLRFERREELEFVGEREREDSVLGRWEGRRRRIWNGNGGGRKPVNGWKKVTDNSQREKKASSRSEEVEVLLYIWLDGRRKSGIAFLYGVSG